MDIFTSPSWDVDDACEDLNRQLFGPSSYNVGASKKKKPLKNSNKTSPVAHNLAGAKQALLTELKDKLASKRKLVAINDGKTSATVPGLKKKKRVQFNIEPAVSNNIPNDIDSSNQASKHKHSKNKNEVKNKKLIKSQPLLKSKEKSLTGKSSLSLFLSKIAKKKAQTEKNKGIDRSFDDADNSKFIAEKHSPKLKKKKQVISMPTTLKSSDLKKNSDYSQSDLVKLGANMLVSNGNKKMKRKMSSGSTSNLEAETSTSDEPLPIVSEKPIKQTIEERKQQNPVESPRNLNQTEVKTSSRRHTGTLRERMMRKLQASRFRYLNEQMYCSKGSEALDYFRTDPDAFQAYHQGYRQQVTQWPLNPIDKIIGALKKKSSDLVIADFGCGEAKLSRSLPNIVHSFDLVAVSKEVTACDMAHTPLGNSTVDIAVFCLSLMGTNLDDYLKEANRVLKVGGVLKVAEVESRFENVDAFIKSLQKYGFAITNKDLSHNLFYFMDLKKVENIKTKKKTPLPAVTLKPCLYKKR